MSLRWRTLSVLGLVLFLGYLAAANFVSRETREAAWYLPNEGLRLGLDLRGGIHMVIGPDLEMAIGHELAAIRSGLDDAIQRKGLTGVKTAVAGDTLRVEARRPATG